MLWYKIGFTQCLFFRQTRVGVEKLEELEWQGDLMNRLIHKNWGENFIEATVDGKNRALSVRSVSPIMDRRTNNKDKVDDGRWRPLSPLMPIVCGSFIASAMGTASEPLLCYALFRQQPATLAVTESL
jgi:hypothetical protein